MTLSYHQRTALRKAMEEKAQKDLSTPCSQEELDYLWNLTAIYWEMLITLPGYENEKLLLRAIDLMAEGE